MAIAMDMMVVFHECLSKVLKPDGVQAVGCGQHHTLVATQVTVVITFKTIIITVVIMMMLLSIIAI